MSSRSKKMVVDRLLALSEKTAKTRRALDGAVVTNINETVAPAGHCGSGSQD